MYKLFLCLKYLRRRYLALIAIAAVALCVAMVLIVVSVMDGFLRKAETAAKGLFGEIIVDSPTLAAIGRYDEFIAELTGKYRMDAEYSLVSVAPSATGGSVVTFEGPGVPSQAEMLAKAVDIDKPVDSEAAGLVYHKGRLIADAKGKVRFSESISTPDPARPDVKKRDYRITFQAVVNLPVSELQGEDAPVLHTLYAIVGKGMPEIESASPVIYSMALLRIPPTYTTTVQVCGMRLPERLGVTDFAGGLFVQKDWHDATFEPPLSAMIQASQRELEEINALLDKQQALPESRQDAELINHLVLAWKNLPPTLRILQGAEGLAKDIPVFQDALAKEQAKPDNQQDKALIARLRERLDETISKVRLGEHHMIVGLAIGGLSFRTGDGQTVRLVTPGRDASLTLLPTGRGKGTMDITPSIRTFSIVDDARTDVHSVDSNTVYVPFETLQWLIGMGEIRDAADPTIVNPALASQINIKVVPPNDSPARLIEVRKKVAAAWEQFVLRHPDASDARWPVEVFTWREKMASFIGAIEKQRTLVTIMFGIISFVSVLLIFAIFYMIVMQKIRDIGVIRAVGGSSVGIAQVFLVYGAATGLVGSVLGLVGGYFFVHYINEIQDFLAVWFGFRVWDREYFLFDKIPNQVDPAVALAIAAWAITSGLVGALIPGVRAAIMEPAEAIRYE